MAGMNETKVSGELFEFGEDRQFNAKIVGTRVDNPSIVKSNENSSSQHCSRVTEEQGGH